MEKQENILDKIGITFHRTLSFKLIILGGLVIVLLIPKLMILSLITERQKSAESAKIEVMDKWSHSQTVTGPFLLIPYNKVITDSDNTKTEITETAVFLPKSLEFNGDMLPKKLNRNIYDVIVYESELRMNGIFERPDFTLLDIKPEDVLWDKAQINLAINDLRGIEEEVALTWNGKSKKFTPGLAFPAFFGNKGISLSLPLNSKNDFQGTFECKLKLKGSQSLMFSPIGENTSASVKSSWNDPKFTGNFLPKEREVNQSGFHAKWNVLHFNRSFPQQWILQSESNIGIIEIHNSDFGVELVSMADNYQKNMRSAKYGILIIIISFLLFFFFEVYSGKRIHPFQYIMAGAAIVIFYLLLLSISEHLGFNKAYLISAAAVVLLVFAYSRSFISSIKTSFGFSIALAACYGFIFVLLQLESYALLAGSLGLFAILALLMFMTRKINWYKE